MNTIVNITGLTLKCLETSDEKDIKKLIVNQNAKTWYQKNKIRAKKRIKNWRKNNPEKIKEYSIKSNSLLKTKEYKKNWHLNKMKDENYVLKRRKTTSQYRKNNKDLVSVYRKKYVSNRLKNNPHFKMRIYLSIRIRKALKGINKSKKTKELLGCTIEQLWIHLEKSFKLRMTRENYGLWHVDHIKPCSSFDLTKPEEQTKCFHYTNLQALWAHENFVKSDKIL